MHTIYIFLRQFFLEQKFLKFFLSEISVYPRFCPLNLGHFLKICVFSGKWPGNNGRNGRFRPKIWESIVRIYIFHQKNFCIRNFCLSQKIRVLAKISITKNAGFAKKIIYTKFDCKNKKVLLQYVHIRHFLFLFLWW